MSFWRYAGYGVALLFGGAVAYKLTRKSANAVVDVNLPQLDPLLKQAQAIIANPATPAAVSAASVVQQAVQAAQQVLAHPSMQAPAKDAATQAVALAQQAIAAAQDPATQAQATDLANQAAQAAAQAQKAMGV